MVDLPNSLEVIDNWIHSGGESKIRSRFIFIYLPERDFTLANISSIFDKYQREFCDPYILEIDIYTDRAMLAKKTKWENFSFSPDFKDDAAGQKAANEYYARVLPSPTAPCDFIRVRWKNFEPQYYIYGKGSDKMTAMLITGGAPHPTVKDQFQPKGCGTELAKIRVFKDHVEVAWSGPNGPPSCPSESMEEVMFAA